MRAMQYIAWKFTTVSSLTRASSSTRDAQRVDEHAPKREHNYEGQLEHRFYRKPQKKPITLHNSSHHSTSTKVQTVKQFYKTARVTSSTPELAEESCRVIDHLLINNGYKDPRALSRTRVSNTKHNNTDTVSLTLPFINDSFTDHIKSFIHTHKLPVRLVLTPGTKLGDIFCSSRPHDRPVCTLTKCIVCPLITSDKYDCRIKGVVYRVKCELCQEFYVGETARPIHDRMLEHRRAAINPTSTSYQNNAFATHYKETHEGSTPILSLEILKSNLSRTIQRKISEADFIQQLKPTLNNKKECESALGFLVSNS